MLHHGRHWECSKTIPDAWIEGRMHNKWLSIFVSNMIMLSHVFPRHFFLKPTQRCLPQPPSHHHHHHHYPTLQHPLSGVTSSLCSASVFNKSCHCTTTVAQLIDTLPPSPFAPQVFPLPRHSGPWGMPSTCCEIWSKNCLASWSLPTPPPSPPPLQFGLTEDAWHSCIWNINEKFGCEWERGQRLA